MKLFLTIITLLMFSCDDGGDNDVEFAPNLNIGDGIWLAKTVNIYYNEECEAEENQLPDFFDYSTLEDDNQRGLELNDNSTYWFNFIPYNYITNVVECNYGLLCEQEGTFIYDNSILTTCSEINPNSCQERTVEAVGKNLIKLTWTFYPSGGSDDAGISLPIPEDMLEQITLCEGEVDLLLEHHNMQPSN